jgi:hypothetical protein
MAISSPQVDIWKIVFLIFFSQFGETVRCENAQPELTPVTRAAIQNAIVRLERKDGRFVGTGVCISGDGTIVMRTTTDLRVRPQLGQDMTKNTLKGDVLKARFVDGREAHPVVVGWSNAWQVAFARISYGNWPFVSLVQDHDLKVGEAICVAECAYDKNEITFNQGLSTREENTWFAISNHAENFPPVFDTEGRLAGIITCKHLDADPIATPASIISVLLASVAREPNLDILQIKSRRDMVDNAPDEKMDGESVAKLTSVQICPENHETGNNGVSGTTVGDNFVVTCGHHFYKPGTNVTVRFSNSDVVPGIVYGLNPITDVGLVKITENKQLPFAVVGSSTRLTGGEKCIVGGYPSEGHKLVIVATSVVKPEGYVWGNVLYTAADGPQIYGGMSGGGIFDQNGLLVGIQNGKNEGQPNRYIRIEFALNQWEMLLHTDQLPNSHLMSK